MNLPNRITTARIIASLGLFAFLAWTDTCAGPEWWPPLVAGSVLIIVVATDALDGHYARKLGQITDFGRIADPVADKLALSGSFIFLTSTDWAQPWLPTWVVVLIVGREFLVTGLRGFVEARGVAFPSRMDGKVKMVVQCVAIPTLFAWRMLTNGADMGWDGPAIPVLIDVAEFLTLLAVWLGLGLALTSGGRYVVAAAQAVGPPVAQHRAVIVLE